jgi:hypothetical protein
MFDINYTHKSGSSAKSKLFYFTASEGMVITEKVPAQAKTIISNAHSLAQTTSPFTLNQLIEHIEDNESNFTNSKGGVDRIVRYYSKLMQNIGVISTEQPVDEEAPTED